MTKFLIASSFLVVSAAGLSAHHTISAYYDLGRHATLKGVVEAIEWKNPHSFITLSVADPDGHALVWQIETQAQFSIRQRSADLVHSIRIGDIVTVTICVSKDGAPQGWLRELVTSAGTTFDVSAGGC